jgi:hypothetical protein
MRLFLLALILAISGCATNPAAPDKDVVVKYKYVVTTVPVELLTMPDPMYTIDVKTATDKEAAIWLIDSEKRAQIIESKLAAIKAFLERKIKELNVPEADVIRN